MNVYDTVIIGAGLAGLTTACFLIEANQRVAGEVRHIQIETASRLRPIKAKYFVLASGGILGGGIHTTDSDHVAETIFNLPIIHDDRRQTWFDAKFITSNGQPVSQYGVQVDEMFSPLDETGQPIAHNLYAVGSLLAHADWTQGRTGGGVAVSSAYQVATQLSERRLT